MKSYNVSNNLNGRLTDKYSKLIFVSLVGIFLFHSNTNALETAIKFAGLSIGMSSNDVISKLISEPEYRVYSTISGNRITSDKQLFLGQNKDTLYPYQEDVSWFNYNCESKKITDGYDQSGHCYNLKSIEYNNIIIEKPSLLFHEDKLITWSGGFKMKKSDYEELIADLSNKYGKYVNEKKTNKYYIYTYKNHSFKISPFIEKNINQLQTNHELYINFVLYDDVLLKKCLSKKANMNQVQYERFVSLEKGKVSLMGYQTEMSKEQVFKILKQKDRGFMYYGEDSKSLANNGRPFSFVEMNIGGEIIKEANNLPDSIYFETDYMSNKMAVELEFNNDKLFSITTYWMIAGGNYMFRDSLHDIMINFYKKNNKIVKRKYREKGGILDEYILDNGNDHLLMNYNNYGSGASFILKSKSIFETIINNKKLLLENEIKRMLSSLNNSSLFEYRLGDKRDTYNSLYYSSNPFSTGRRSPIDFNFQDNIHKYHEKEQDQYYSESICCVPDIVEIITNHDTIQSVSVGISPRFPQNHKSEERKERLKSTIDVITNFMNTNYGKENIVEYRSRKSKYWKVNSNIFELILEDNNYLYTYSGGYNSDVRIFISFRKMVKDDLIFKVTKKSLLD